MGRKKVLKQPDTLAEENTKNQNKPINNTGKLGYSGLVTITIKEGNTVIDKRKYKNHGTANLFKYICGCLAGDYYNISDLMPNKIELCQLTRNSSLIQGESVTFNWKQIWNPEGDNDIKAEAVSPLISLSELPNYKITAHDGSTDSNTNTDPANENDKCEIKFKFMIPATYLVTGKDINLIKLYGKNQNISNGDGLAYYILTDTDDKIKPIRVTTGTNLIIEWTMTIANIAPNTSSSAT